MSFHWRGKTKEGVSRWVGAWSAPPRWFGLIFFGYGVLAGCAGLGCLLYALLYHSWQTAGVLALVGGIHGLVFGGTGAWMLSFRRYILGLSGIRQVGEYLGVDEASAQRMAQERGIKPRLNINGQDLYDVRDFVASPLRIR
jgi:hypothetical protein